MYPATVYARISADPFVAIQREGIYSGNRHPGGSSHESCFMLK